MGSPRSAAEVEYEWSYLDKIPVNRVGAFEEGLLNHLRNNRKDILDWITNEDPKIKGDAADKLRAALDTFATDFA